MKIKFTKKEIPELSLKIIKKVLNKKNKEASVIAFYGDLGVGKTTLTKEIGKQLGVKGKIVSPTFVIMKTYKINSIHKFKKLIHIDAYRLDSDVDLLNLEWAQMIKNSENLIILEWPEKVKNLILRNFIKIEILHINENSRIINFIT